ncbi:glycosyltransferase [Bifidobacterium tibiigranuli]|uniref:glycosyltransferase n=1 Tax=Bifidobacterium tibiigranuli TaxID=2172043 RepID=UPI0023562872|nr:glycosyltransferase [Bifidobacterium tibiigranuli]MCH3975799.1 glycosyltransferase [Bifidobacterium tibiigranuli]MCH4189281.1 glycosyltransferase [Bifidobacterium tibiigranuli]MCH4203084.1 glycosyltransferase [Bifidobacterium tibiigranuli]MCH4274767.1 glycosyltransferase [Bifidobacterium tibiigranuli]MCI1211643.1 glycosyltransferase [Bifidobacterium tibiigranuli]
MHTMYQSGTDTDDRNWEAVSRVVFPVSDQDLVLPLYAIEWTRPHLTDDVFNPRLDMEKMPFDSMNSKAVRHLLNESIEHHADTAANDVFTVDSRHAMTVLAGRNVSLCTFFNAFPASYWKRWTSVSAVRFSAKVRGTGEIALYKSSGRGLFSALDTISVDTAHDEATLDADGFASIETVLPMNGLIDGGYFWFDAKAGNDTALHIEDAQWSVPRGEKTAAPSDTGSISTASTTLSIAITTFNRAKYCMRQLRTIAHEPALVERLDTIYCTDQGTDLVRNQPGFKQVAEELGSRLTYLRQTNMGGSAGFSRGMYETLKAGTSSYTLLLDDDAISEPEAILRALQFADYTRHPTIVGGGMLHLDNRTVLYTQGERFNPHTVWMDPSQGLDYNHDFARFPLRDSPERHRRIDSDFNGWWMCLIPTAIMKEIGLSMPFFIKFDDTEYALRAAEHGYHTVCLPGVAVWHQAWHDKDPSRTWEEYFFQRNRWICGLLHCPKPSRRFAFEMLYGDVNVGIKLVYSALRLRHMGLRDILRGPQYILESMPGKMAQVQQARKGFADTTLITDVDEVPAPAREFVMQFAPTTSKAIKKSGLKAIARALVSRGNGTKDAQPDVAIPSDQAIWRSFVGVNSALVTSPDGNTVAWCRRDSALFRKQIREGLRISQTLLKNWGRLSQEYRESDICSIDAWGKVFKEQTITD